MPCENRLGASFERFGLNIGAKLTRLSTKILPASPEKTYRDGAAALRRVNRQNELNGICFEYTHPNCRDQDWDWETPRRRSAVSQVIGAGAAPSASVSTAGSRISTSNSNSSSSSASTSESESSGPRFSISSSSSRSSRPEHASIDLDFEVPVLDTKTNLMMLKTGHLRQSAPIVLRSQ